jgi:hypothetical protein
LENLFLGMEWDRIGWDGPVWPIKYEDWGVFKGVFIP